MRPSAVRTAAALAACLAAACSSSAPQPQSQPNETAPVATTTPASAPANTTLKETAMPATNANAGFHALATQTLDGQPADLAQYKGKVLLVVNTASQCGLTPQYAGLEKLHEELAARGFSVLGFPSNDFGGQEPGTPAEIQQFCSTNYGVKFPLFEKVQTKAGAGQSPVYAWLQSQSGQLPRWNFGKYLISKDGTQVEFFDSRVAPEDPALRSAIDAALAK